MGNRMISFDLREDAEVQTEDNEPLIAASIVIGILYEGEEVQFCPLCADRLMWYHLPQDMEILTCVNPMCVYPFDDTTPYNIRSRSHGKVCIVGAPAPFQDKHPISGDSIPASAPCTSAIEAETELSLEP